MSPGSNKIKLTIDTSLKDVVPQYLENRKKDISNIKSHIQGGDFENIRILAHSMKGSGGGYGFDEITKIGASMEQAAKDKNRNSIEKFLSRLEAYLSNIEITYG
jgi:HPt (histidine-containing phosphotransfer) domain-containing protein